MSERVEAEPGEAELAQALFGTLYAAGVSFVSADLIPRLTAAVRAVGFRYTPPQECICYGPGVDSLCLAHEGNR
ncbi:hypothetical protein [Microbacterium sp. NPDC080220]|uniref:hypothetical protein n=1 Tax=Microbacterium sp. NPDC080220 TaxID=3161017 RepID=UPI00341D7D11